jgi:hypothetical protein
VIEIGLNIFLLIDYLINRVRIEYLFDYVKEKVWQKTNKRPAKENKPKFRLFNHFPGYSVDLRLDHVNYPSSRMERKEGVIYNEAEDPE